MKLYKNIILKRFIILFLIINILLIFHNIYTLKTKYIINTKRIFLKKIFFLTSYKKNLKFLNNKHKNKIYNKLYKTYITNEVVDLENYRNIGIIAHIDAGKTTTTERILYYTNVIKKIGEVHEGLSTMDYLDIEKEKGITVNSAVTTCYWKGSDGNLKETRINIIDTPGHVDFTAEVEKSLRVLDGSIVIFDSSEGVESQSETVWKQANEYNISRIIFLNKLDKVGSNFESCIEEIKKKLNKKILILYVPIFEMSKFISTIDILKEKIIYYKNTHDFFYEDIPKEYYDIFLKYKNLLYEEIAINFNTFMEYYLNDKIININEIEMYIRKLVIEKHYNVIICGSSLKNKNIHMLLDMVVKYLPNPIDCIDNYKKQIIHKYDVNKKGEKININDINIKNDIKHENDIYVEINKNNIKNKNRKFIGLIYKIMNDQHLGNVNYIRIYEGQIKKGDIIYNNRTKKNEKINKIFFIHSNEKHEIEKASRGDIVAVVGLKDTEIGDTVTNMFLRAELKKIKNIPPIISYYIYNKNKNEYEKLINALKKIKKEDHSFFYHINEDTKDLIISGIGELHLQIIINKIEKDYNIPIIYGNPQISYKETFIETVEARGKYIKQSGGRGQYGDVYIRIKPMYNYTKEENNQINNINQNTDQNVMNINTSDINNNIIIENKITCGAIPSEYFDAIYTGIKEQCNLGVIFNSPLINIIITILDGSFHSVDSNEHAFKLAAQLAIKEAAKKTNIRLLEPIMNLNVSIPNEYLGDVISDLIKKRGKIQHIDENDDLKKINVQIPMSSILSYVSDLRKITKGRGNYTMTLYKYSLVPDYIQEQILQKKI